LLSKGLYYILVYPISLLPLRLIYLFTDFLYFFLRSVYPYRKKVIEENLKNAFPEKSKHELSVLKQKFYKHFTDIIAEGIKNLSISEKALKKRLKVKNPEIMEKFFTEKKSVLLVSGHFNNWEWLITAQNFIFPHQAVGIGMPLSNKFWHKKMNEKRSRFGMKIIHSKNVKENFEKWKNETIATLILADQSPGDSSKSYWTDFLNQKTAIAFGCEQLAHSFQHAVVFFKIKKLKRGYYELELETITDNPSSLQWGEISEKHTKLLEKTILEKPEFWIWSHKRWKREIPTNLEELREFQKNKFNEKYKR
jgi:Kdo2-lipid IVA lauroyltransferase/acyltransferase